MKIVLSVIFGLSLAYSSGASAQSGSWSKRGNSENVHWNLGDWLTQKQSFALMDQWLAINTQQNFVEFGLSGGQTDYELSAGTSTTSHKLERYNASLYVSIFGLEGGFEKSDEKRETTYGQFNIRLLGKSSQDTQLVLGYGARKIDDEEDDYEVTNQYGNVTLQIYLVSFFGIEGSYKKFLKAKDDDNTEHEGERAEYGAFIEFSFVRLYGRIFEERSYQLTAIGEPSKEFREGADAGVRFFF